MPELPEVETTLRGIAPHLLERRIERVDVRQRTLRWRVPDDLEVRLTGRRAVRLRRRAKYLLIGFDDDRDLLMIHLGMSGSLRVVPEGEPPARHDHVDLVLDSGHVLRFNDPRRFGSWLLVEGETHPLLCSLGVEPLSDAFDAAYLHERSRGRRLAVKAFIMDQRIVVGVGNIYASEALFRAGIHPRRAAGRISRFRYAELTERVRNVLNEAIQMGGTTLRDFVHQDGRPGYFKQSLQVYGREGQDCNRCGRVLRHAWIGQRSSVYCPGCQR